MPPFYFGPISQSATLSYFSTIQMQHYSPFFCSSCASKPAASSSFSVETIAPPPQWPRRTHAFLPHWPTDGRRTHSSSLVRGVTSVGHLGTARGASGRVRFGPGASDRGHVSCCTSTMPQLADATHLQNNVLPPAPPFPIRAEQVQGNFLNW